MSRLDHALEMVRTYLAECARREDWGDPRTAELTEVIRSCVECIGASRRGHAQDGDARLEQQALRHAIGYVDERSAPAQANHLTSEFI